MSRNVPITWEKEQEIIAALEKDPHASRVARALGDVNYATAWRIVDRNAIALAAGRETMGRRLPPDRRATGIEGRRANPDDRRTRLRSKPASAGQARGASKGMAPAAWRSSQRRGAPNGGYVGNVAERRFAAL